MGGAAWMRGAAAAARPVLMALAALLLAAPSPRAEGEPPASRVALVVGEGAYRAGGALPAAPDDAGLVAEVLAGAGFAVTGARDLDGEGLRRAFRDFLDRAATAGPDGIAVVYFAGRAIQADGDNFLVPVDARLARPSDVPIEALRLADFTHALASLPIQARVVVVDGAYAGGPAADAARGTSTGLALVDAEQGELLAFNAAPGTEAPATSDPYGTYAQALVAAVKQGGVPVEEVFARVRLAVDAATGGAVVPWEADRLTRSFTVFDRAPGAPATTSAQIPFASLAKRPLRDVPPDQAYDLALVRDSLPAYAEFLAAFPASPLARRVRLIQAVRRDALFWRAAMLNGTQSAYWTYLARYPKGAHAGDARRRLSRLSAAAPPLRFVPLGFDVLPPPPDEVAVATASRFDAPGLPPPPPPPVFLLPPFPLAVLKPPAPPPGPALLPAPVPVAIPFVRAPVEPGVITPPRGVAGAYPHPRPFARGPNGDGLVVQATPPAFPQPAPGAPPGPAHPTQPAPPQAGSGARPEPTAQPAAPSAPSAAAPIAPAPRVPALPRMPEVPAGKPVSLPTASVSPAPAGVPEAGRPHGQPPQPSPETPVGTAAPRPAAAPGLHLVPAPGRAPVPRPTAVPPTSLAAPPPAQARRLAAPFASGSAPASHLPQRPPTPERPAGANHPGLGLPRAHAPAELRPGCGHPGTPPCHP